jgi:prefoldin subunit 5
MGSQAEKYRTRGDELTDQFFDARFLDIDLRLVSLEQQLGQFDQATDQLIERGLDRINTQLGVQIEALQSGVTSANEAIVTVEATLASIEEALAEIVSGSVQAALVPVTPSGPLTATNAQTALEDLANDVDALIDDVDALQAQVNGLGDVQTVADLTAAAALVGLDKGDVVHVLDNGSSKWVRYQVTAAGDGTWGGATKVVIFTQDQQPASHVHAIADITNLQTALDARALSARNINTSGLATGGGNLTGDRTINVPAASASQFREATSNDVVVTPAAVSGAMAEQQLTDAATVAWDMAAGFDFRVTLAGNRTLANPTNVTIGKKGRIRVIQDATGGRTLAFGTAYSFAGKVAPSLSAAAAAVDWLCYDVRAVDDIIVSALKNVGKP